MEEHQAPIARELAERFSPVTGVPLRVGQLWPPRLVIHNASTKADAEQVVVSPTAWFRHFLRRDVVITIEKAGDAVDPRGWAAQGLRVDSVKADVPSAGHRGELGAGGQGYHPLPVKVTWTRAFVEWIQDVEWVRVPLQVHLSDGRWERIFQWYLYITPHAAELPRQSSQYDENPHFRWVDPTDGVLSAESVARSWIEVPAPMSSPALQPACWVQNDSDEPPDGGPGDVDLVPIFPVEPPIPAGMEAVGWNGAIGGHDPRPRVQALAVRSRQTAGQWGAFLFYLDTPSKGHSRAVRQVRSTLIEEPTDCVWPEVKAAEERPTQLYDLIGRTESGCEVKVNLSVVLPDNAEGLRLYEADIRLGTETVGRWEGPAVDLSAGQQRSLTCRIELHKLRDAADGRLKLTMAFIGRPTRGVVRGEHVFRTQNGPWGRLMRSKAEGGRLLSPWLCIDMGSEGTCASVAFLEGYAPRVVSVRFDEGPIYPTRIHLSPDLAGAWTLTDEPRDDSLYTTLIKMGLRYGDGAHPGCPDHIAATEVARFFLKRFLLEVKERMAWFPLEDADVLVSFPPRLASIPMFVSSLRDTFRAVLEEVVWTGEQTHRLRFREEGFLVAVPTLYKDLEVAPLPPGGSRYYWVMDFGGGTTDVCGFLCTADEWGEEHTVSHLTYPQRLAHHLSGNDVTRAFYGVLHRHLVGCGVVAGPREAADEDHGRGFPIPNTPFPSARSTPTALLNQNCLRELADALKCISPTEQPAMTLRSLARTLKDPTIRTVDEVATTLVALLAGDARPLGDRRILDLHAEVLDPLSAAQLYTATQQIAGSNAPAADQQGKKAAVRCSACGEMHTLPVWALSENRAFRFRCRACGHAQRAHIQQDILPDAGDDQTPTILHYQDVQVQEGVPDAEAQDLYVEQDGRTYMVRDWETLRRWVAERRVGPDDLMSEGGVSWLPLGEHPGMQDLFEAGTASQPLPNASHAPVLSVPREASPSDEPGLERDIELFLAACGQALERAMRGLPAGEATDVVVLVAGRASRFGPIARLVKEQMPGRVVHLTNEWVRRSYGNTGQIDPTADLKTLTANGGGLFAVLHSHAETSHLVLSFDTNVMDTAVYLQPAANTRPWLLADQLDLRPGQSTLLPREDDEHSIDASTSQESASAEEPRPRPLPMNTPLAGDLKLVVEGLSEDRSWEPYVTIAVGTARRHQGRRPRINDETQLITEAQRFVLGPLSNEREVVFTRMLPHLELLGGEAEEENVTP